MTALRTHGRYRYSPIVERPTYEWPNGARLAVHLAVNLEVFPFGEGMGVPLANPQPEPDVVNFGWRDYGNRVGVWNLLELLDELALPCGALLNTAIYDECPQVAAAFRARGDEIVAHGHTNAERQSGLDEPAERALIEGCRDRIMAEEGAPPRGWMGPWVAETAVTPDLLAEAGFDYVLDWPPDDQPIMLGTRSGRPLVAVPYARPMNDLPALHGNRWPPSVWADATLDGFAEMRRLSARRPLVFNLSLHPYLVGVPFRLRHLRRVLETIAAARDAVWVTTPGAIAAHARGVLRG